MYPNEDVYAAIFGKDKAMSMPLGRDMATLQHAERVNDLTMMIGLNCGLSVNELCTLQIAATFHDIGKIGVSDRLLDKPAYLDIDEWNVIKKHAEIGEQLMLSSKIPNYSLSEVARAIRHHHENFDGSGYPDGLSGSKIPLLSRIIAIADNYDAMTEERAYRRPRRHKEIMFIMRSESGSKFEPRLIHIFSEHIEHSPLRVA